MFKYRGCGSRPHTFIMGFCRDEWIYVFQIQIRSNNNNSKSNPNPKTKSCLNPNSCHCYYDELC